MYILKCLILHISLFLSALVATTVNLTSNFRTISNTDPIHSVRSHDTNRGGGG
jgi:hypothetical protein